MVTGCSELTRAESNNVQKRNYAILVGPVEGWFDHSKYGTGRVFTFFRFLYITQIYINSTLCRFLF